MESYSRRIQQTLRKYIFGTYFTSSFKLSYFTTYSPSNHSRRSLSSSSTSSTSKSASSSSSSLTSSITSSTSAASIAAQSFYKIATSIQKVMLSFTNALIQRTTPLFQKSVRHLSSSSSSSSSGPAVEASLKGLVGRHFLSIDELSNEELRGLLDLSKHYKNTYGKQSTVNPLTAPKPLTGQSTAMIFQKRSTRTRVSTETGMYLLGGHSLFLGPSDIQLGVNESMKDTALVLSRFNSLILARVFDHSDIVELAEHASVPVINALSELHHPLQTLADLMALEDHFGTENMKGKSLAWVGDGNNVLHDLMLGCAKLGVNVRIATPKGYECNPMIMQKTKELAVENGTEDVFVTNVAEEAVKGSDVVVTDTWVSMGQEDEYEARLKEFDGYEVNSALMAKANPGAVFLHCLPRHPEEVTDDVFYSDASLIFPEAENRMWTVMSVMAAQLGKY